MTPGGKNQEQHEITKEKKLQVHFSLQFLRQPRGHKHRNDAAGKEMDE